MRNGKMQNLSNMEITESKVDSESRFRVLVLDSDLESKTDLQSHQTLESSLLDSRSHGYVPDSHHHLFAQKEKGFPLSPLSPAPKKPPLFAQPQSISFGGRASLSPCLVKNAKNALLHFFNAFF
ncbi:hypothetical protein [uncultured Helicobacter sp.]|uniref:hypothetical protein n=1 Tax=uncultured Helicobacter sp. TaxID=175537 RepID=UPI00375317F9